MIEEHLPKPSCYVNPCGYGIWEVRDNQTDRLLGTFDSQNGAMDYAKELDCA